MDSILRLQRIARTKWEPRKKKKFRSSKNDPEMKKLVEIRNRSSQSFYQSETWLRIRYRVLVKNGRRCQACGAEGLNIRLHVDHIKPRSKYPELQFLESNLQVLCESCNIGKSNIDETDWRKV